MTAADVECASTAVLLSTFQLEVELRVRIRLARKLELEVQVEVSTPSHSGRQIEVTSTAMVTKNFKFESKSSLRLAVPKCHSSCVMMMPVVTVTAGVTTGPLAEAPHSESGSGWHRASLSDLALAA